MNAVQGYMHQYAIYTWYSALKSNDHAILSVNCERYQGHTEYIRKHYVIFMLMQLY